MWPHPKRSRLKLPSPTVSKWQIMPPVKWLHLNMHVDTKKRWVMWVGWRCTDRRGGPRCCRTCSGPPHRWARQTPAWRRCSPSPPSQLLSSSLLGITRAPGAETGRDTPAGSWFLLKTRSFLKNVFPVNAVNRVARLFEEEVNSTSSYLFTYLFIYYFFFTRKHPEIPTRESPIFFIIN